MIIPVIMNKIDEGDTNYNFIKKDNKNINLKFIAVLFTITKGWKQPKVSWIDE